tara:strand:- start:1114 stop:1689 length:576 start_codon:yes stop_codon:yes gene_type:complete
MNTDNFIYVADIMFPDNLCDLTINLFENKLKLFADTHFSKNAHSERGDEACFVDDFEMIVGDDIANGGLTSDINAHLDIALQEYVSIFSSISNMQIRSTRQKIQKTQKSGGYHVWHHEQAHIDVTTRVLTWSIYLNDVEDGGETEFLYQSQRIKPKKGKILIFPAAFTHTHRGNPPLTGDKYILTGWWNII